MGQAGLSCHTGWQELEAGVGQTEPGYSTCWQMVRLWVDQLRLGHSTCWHVQELELSTGPVGELWGLPCWDAASTDEPESWHQKWAGLRAGQACLAAALAGMHKSQNGCGPANLECSADWQVLGMGVSHVRLDCSIHWQLHSLGLGTCLAGEQ